MSWVSNDDVHQGSETFSDDKDIHSSLGVVKEKVRDLLLNMCSTPIIVAIIYRYVLCTIVHSLSEGHQSKWILRSSMV